MIKQSETAAGAAAAPMIKQSEAAAAGTRHASRRRHARRPLIYVYDLEYKFTTGQFQQRTDFKKCVTRIRSNEMGEVEFVESLYGVETALHEMLLDSPHRTEDPQSADFFFVPVYHFCFISRLQQPMPDHSNRR